jgi:Leucine-rich repeat (LRR) protein
MKSVFIMAFLCYSFSMLAQYHMNMDRWITNLSDARRQAEHVYNLDLSSQHLKEIPYEIRNFVNLEALKLSDNDILHLDGRLKFLKKLKFVELSGNRMYSIDFSEFEGSKNTLEEIWIRENNLRKVEGISNHFEQLKILDLGGNLLTELSDDIQLPALHSLDLDANQLTTLPEFLVNTTKLKTLNLSGNQITVFEINPSLRKLKVLNLSDNPLEHIDWGNHKMKVERLILDWISLDETDILSMPKSVEILSMEHCGLSSVAGIVHLRKLKELSLLHNNITELPEDFHRLKNLKKLWVGGNPLKDITRVDKKVEIVP